MSFATRSTALAIVVLAATAHPVVAAAQGPAPVPGRPYQYWDVLEADGGARKVYFRNDSADPITITELVVQVCDNTRQKCGSYPANLVVAPGKTVVAFKIEQFDRKAGWHFAYSFHTRGATQVQAARGAPPPALVRGPDGALLEVKTVGLEELTPAVEAVTTNGICGMWDAPGLPAGHKSLIMVFGTPVEPTARQVRVRYNASGIAYELNDSRRGIGSTATDPHTTSITIDPVRESVTMRNAGDGQPASWLRATGPTVMTSAALGQPGEMVARIWKECGGSK